MRGSPVGCSHPAPKGAQGKPLTLRLLAGVDARSCWTEKS